jgi:hypothetical protein
MALLVIVAGLMSTDVNGHRRAIIGKKSPGKSD